MIDDRDDDSDLRAEMAQEYRERGKPYGMTQEEAEEDAVMTANEAAYVNQLIRSA